MIKNYLKIAWRSLIKNKVSSFINIGGLAIGMAVAMLNGLWVWDELSFNKYHQNYESIAKVTKRGTNDGKLYANPVLPVALAGELKTSYGPHFKHILLACQPGESILTAGEKKLSMKGQFIEPGAPEMLSLKMLRGSRSGLQDKQSIILSSSAARAIFGNDDPLNKVLQINKDMDAKVTGVYEDLPHNTEFHAISFFAPFELWASVNSWVKNGDWENHFLNTYVQLKPGKSFQQISDLIKNAELNKIRNMDNRKEELARNRQVWLLPMSDWHLRSDLSSNAAARLVIMIGMIGAFVLLLACINFMNLSTARSEKRAKEVGVRKAIGSQRGQLIRQFFSESFLVSLIAFILAVLLVFISMPWFNEIAAKQMKIPFTNLYFWLIGLGLILFTALIAGSYPALYLSSFQPISALKGTFRVGRLAAIPRKALVVVQFTISVALIIGTIIVFRQIGYAKSRPVGYNRNGLLLIEKKSGDFYGKFDVLQRELLNTGVVSSFAESRSSTTGITMWNGGFSYKGKELEIQSGSGTLSVTSDYGKTVGWEFVGGRDFSPRLVSDSSGLVINESFAKAIGLKNPVGETITWAPGWREPQSFTILGVVKDMLAISPYEPAIPTVFFLSNKYHTWFNIRLNPLVSTAAALPKIEAVFKKIIPTAPFDYKFADAEYALKFAAEDRVGKLATFFAVLSILISCLGLFGLASFVAEQRTKEIGVRKVLGATIFDLWKLLSIDFVVLVIFSCCIAGPIAYYFLHSWLQNYVYRTEISWWIFAVAIAGTLVITLLTVSFQAIKAAIANPVKSLRTE
jgi:ABC-type antimicrobial peptide transport system permease subunit